MLPSFLFWTACAHQLDLSALPLAPQLILSCNPCTDDATRFLGTSWVPLHPAPEQFPTRLSLSQSLAVTCDHTGIHASIPESALLALPSVPVDLVGRCPVGDRETVFVVTLDRKGR